MNDAWHILLIVRCQVNKIANYSYRLINAIHLRCAALQVSLLFLATADARSTVK